MKKEAVLEEYRQLVLTDARRLFFSQSVLAHGQTFLFRIDKIKVGKNKWINGEPKLVTDPDEMESYLYGVAQNANGDVEDDKDPSAAYYFLTAREPNNQAIDSMLDRAFGKAKQMVGLEGSTPGSPIEVLHSLDIDDTQYERILTHEFNRIGADTSLAPAVDGATETGADSAQSGEGPSDSV